MGEGVLSRRAFVAGLSAGLAGATQASAAPGGIDPKRVARIAIHPAIGVARVGNSKDAFYFGPEVPGGVPVGPFKDEAGAMARQAARFRLFAYDAQGRVLGEVTAREAEISWTLTVPTPRRSGTASTFPSTCPAPPPPAAATPRWRTAPASPSFPVRAPWPGRGPSPSGSMVGPFRASRSISAK